MESGFPNLQDQEKVCTTEVTNSKFIQIIFPALDNIGRGQGMVFIDFKISCGCTVEVLKKLEEKQKKQHKPKN